MIENIYIIIPSSELQNVSGYVGTPDTQRFSLDGTKVVLKYGDYEDFENIEAPRYSHETILTILSSDEWTPQET